MAENTGAAPAMEATATPPATVQTPARTHLGLKITVGVLSLLLVAGFALVAGTIAWRLAAGAAQTTDRAGWGVKTLLVEPGDAPVAMVLNGDRLAVRLAGPGGTDILVLDARRGRELGRFRLRETPP